MKLETCLIEGNENLSISDMLSRKEVKAEDVAKNVIKNPRLLPELFNGISSENTRTRFKSAKVLRIISAENPEMLYSKMHFFTNLLNSKNKILKWIAIDVIGNLSSVDTENKFDKIFNKFFDLLADESMITAGHVIDSSGKIARAKPHLQDKITKELLRVEKTEYKTSECKNILLGKVILSFSQYIDQISDTEEMVSLAKRQRANPRKATRVKAEKFLRTHNSVG